MRSVIFAAALASCAALAGCDRGKAPQAAPAAPAASPQAPASASAAGPLVSLVPTAEPRGVLAAHVMGGVGAQLGMPQIRFVNRAEKPIATFDLRVYFYNAAGAQLRGPVTITKTPVRPLRPRKLRELEIDLGDIPPGATIEAVVPHVVFADQSEWRDDTIAPEERPLGG